MKLYTIGFTKKTAEQFFGILRNSGIQRLVDIRLNPSGQLSGFSKQEDLPYFLKNLVNGCHYIYQPLLAPSVEILKDYRRDRNWLLYIERFETLMDERKIPESLDQSEFGKFTSCLLCSEASPEQCHRRLVAERLSVFWPNVEVIHL